MYDIRYILVMEAAKRLGYYRYERFRQENVAVSSFCATAKLFVSFFCEWRVACYVTFVHLLILAPPSHRYRRLVHF